MAQFRKALPQLEGGFFLTDGGIETRLIWRRTGEAALRKYFQTYARLAQRLGTGLILESATWRASADWGEKLGYSAGEIADANRRAISLLEIIRAGYRGDAKKVVISGCVGPRGDRYNPSARMTGQEAWAYHRRQIQAFDDSAADMVSAMTMNYVEEAIGIVRAAQSVSMPVAVSFTVETDGRLPTGQTLRSAIEQVDKATARYPAYYMINCAHPTHFEPALAAGEAWVRRIRGLRANASRKSHAELNEASELDIGDPVELGMQHAALKGRFPQLNVMGGCCGTDHRHVEQIAMACAKL